MGKEIQVEGFHLPEGLRVYAVGDIHGCLAELDALHEVISADLIERPPQEVHIVYLGDFIDRGPDSQGVINRLMERRDRGDGIAKSFLAGNHELAAFEFIRNPMGADEWLKYGGRETLQSFGVTLEEGALPGEVERASMDFKDNITTEQWDFFKNLEIGFALGDYFFAHAGIDPAKPLMEQLIEDMTSIREPFLSWEGPMEKMIVHGHTKTSGAPEVQSHRINVDTGCYETGILTAAVLEGDTLRFVQAEKSQ